MAFKKKWGLRKRALLTQLFFFSLFLFSIPTSSPVQAYELPENQIFPISLEVLHELFAKDYLKPTQVQYVQSLPMHLNGVKTKKVFFTNALQYYYFNSHPEHSQVRDQHFWYYKLPEYALSLDNWATGIILGLQIKWDTTPLKSYFFIKEFYGEKPPAFDAGLRVGDRILYVNDKYVGDAVIEREVGDEIRKQERPLTKITVDRNGKQLSFNVERKRLYEILQPVLVSYEYLKFQGRKKGMLFGTGVEAWIQTSPKALIHALKQYLLLPMLYDRDLLMFNLARAENNKAWEGTFEQLYLSYLKELRNSTISGRDHLALELSRYFTDCRDSEKECEGGFFTDGSDPYIWIEFDKSKNFIYIQSPLSILLKPLFAPSPANRPKFIIPFLHEIFPRMKINEEHLQENVFQTHRPLNLKKDKLASKMATYIVEQFAEQLGGEPTF